MLGDDASIPGAQIAAAHRARSKPAGAGRVIEVEEIERVEDDCARFNPRWQQFGAGRGAKTLMPKRGAIVVKDRKRIRISDQQRAKPHYGAGPSCTASSRLHQVGSFVFAFGRAKANWFCSELSRTVAPWVCNRGIDLDLTCTDRDVAITALRCSGGNF